MFNKHYRLRYLPLFYSDMEEKLLYIAETLQNPNAAINLLKRTESAILERLPIADSFEPYHSSNEHRYAYYRIYVGNYIVYYVLIDDDPDDLIMEVRRFLYVGQNRNDAL